MSIQYKKGVSLIKAYEYSIVIGLNSTELPFLFEESCVGLGSVGLS